MASEQLTIEADSGGRQQRNHKDGIERKQVCALEPRQSILWEDLKVTLECRLWKTSDRHRLSVEPVEDSTYGEELRSNSLLSSLLAIENTHGGLTGNVLSRIFHGKFLDRCIRKKTRSANEDRLFNSNNISCSCSIRLFSNVLHLTPGSRSERLLIRGKQDWGAAWEMFRSVSSTLSGVCPVSFCFFRGYGPSPASIPYTEYLGWFRLGRC